MDNKQIVTLETDDGEKEAEILTVVTIEGKGNYAIYKVDDEFYGAKYELDENGTKLDADLTNEEKEALNKAFEKLVNEDA